jgi:ethanolamine ammonia-lyase small subunit
MSIENRSLVTRDPWNRLRGATPARIALGRAGGSLPTREWLQFKSAHAAARDAVHNELLAEELASQIGALGVDAIIVDSAARDRLTFLQRPDLGRRLDDASHDFLAQLVRPPVPPQLAVIVSDGLSALAVHRQVPPLLRILLPWLRDGGVTLAPIVIARFGRVALQDEVGRLLGAQLALMLIGERPGLGSPDSLGAYLVFSPRPGNTDANRNCVSNIRPEGLAIDAAAATIRYLVAEAQRRHLSGIGLKDERGLALPPGPGSLPDQR